MTTFGALKQGGGLLEMALRNPPLFFGAGLLAEVPKSFLGSIKITSFPKVYKVLGDFVVSKHLHFVNNTKFS